MNNADFGWLYWKCYFGIYCRAAVRFVESRTFAIAYTSVCSSDISSKCGFSLKENHFGAQEKSYFDNSTSRLDSRMSFLRNKFTGSCSSFTTHILQSKELEYCTYKTLKFATVSIYKFRVFVSTFNVNGQPPEANLLELFCQRVTDPPPDIYAVGFQELDLSQQTFLFDITSREEEWARVVLMNLKTVGDYVELKRVRLVGMFLVIYVTRELHQRNVISEFATATVGTGVLNRMGNKGGVAIRFRLYDSWLCFVNCHFAAGADELERRNQDFREISKTMFCDLANLGIFDHDEIFWFGDMNYRLSEDGGRRTANATFVKEACEIGLFESLLHLDQLSRMKSIGLAFQEFTEGKITFLPTYKYDIGTDTWDSSEKGRTPAWCDRILWCGDHIEQIAYESVPSVRMSDHKPVRAIFSLQAKVVDNKKLQTLFEAALRESDRLENQWLPQVSLDKLEFEFKDVRFLEPLCQPLTITNIGRVPVYFEFRSESGQSVNCKPWLSITPDKYRININEKCVVDLQVLIEKETVWKIDSSGEKLDSILVLHLDNGKDFFITVHAEYVPGCFGISLEKLYNTVQPGECSSSASKLIDIDPVESADVKRSSSFPIPKEIWLLVDYIYKNGLDEENLFAQAGSHPEFISIRNTLDAGNGKQLSGSVRSVAETLLRFLDSLPEPLVPTDVYELCFRNVRDYGACKRAIASFPTLHNSVFIYLICFLREVLHHSAKNKTSANGLAVIFAPILFRFPEPAGRIFTRRATLMQKMQLATQFLETLFRGKQDDLIEL
ncbi:Inositol polyphosphate 5-phosphatase OCRL-1 [Trichinella sp. T8]|uniref:Inositol polyphosphate 5-phosphatase OCRL-1 n=2 Tax=Trichinella TaxID=6333 RepID=A0A0V0UD46_9BILA|nr:Inositol polyphosphate 5-phosphatase OCRL-1 [Trichinella murrelli]KRZ86288.1 Inositol polyphosphate 5-phosphatase OCRL-1 [Trichinella sp. T8]